MLKSHAVEVSDSPSLELTPAQAASPSELPKSLATPPENHYDKATVAALAPPDISEMSSAQLIAAIKVVRFPAVPNDQPDRLEYQDRATLEKLVFLARRCCRNQGY